MPITPRHNRYKHTLCQHRCRTLHCSTRFTVFYFLTYKLQSHHFVHLKHLTVTEKYARSRQGGVQDFTACAHQFSRPNYAHNQASILATIQQLGTVNHLQERQKQGKHLDCTTHQTISSRGSQYNKYINPSTTATRMHILGPANIRTLQGYMFSGQPPMHQTLSR